MSDLVGHSDRTTSTGNMCLIGKTAKGRSQGLDSSMTRLSYSLGSYSEGHDMARTLFGQLSHRLCSERLLRQGGYQAKADG